MTLPFHTGSVFSIFGSYNDALWPFAIALWLASFAALICLVRGKEGRQRFINLLLVTHWLWAAMDYMGVPISREIFFV